jgi:hypothetical protein
MKRTLHIDPLLGFLSTRDVLMFFFGLFKALREVIGRYFFYNTYINPKWWLAATIVLE